MLMSQDQRDVSNWQKLQSLNSLALSCRNLWEKVTWCVYRYDAQEFGSSALLWAAEKGITATVHYSLDQGGQTRTLNKFGQDPLWLAARYNHKPVAEILLKYEHHIETKNPAGLTPLAVAARENHTTMIQFLLQHGANINSQTSDGATPLLWAIRNGSVDAVEILTTWGAKLPDKDTKAWRKWALTACRAGFNKWIDNPAMMNLMNSFYDAGQERSLREQPLVHAIKNQFLALSKYLLDSNMYTGNNLGMEGFNHPSYVQLLDPDNCPMWWAVYHGDEELVRRLLELGHEVNLRIKWKDETREPTRLLSLAMIRHFPGIAELLLEHGASPDYMMWDEHTPLSRAVQMGNTSLVQKMLDKGPRMKPYHPKSPLLIAVGMQHPKMVRILLEGGTYADCRIRLHRRGRVLDYGSILSYAQRLGNQEIVEALHEYGRRADLD
ncbi:ankyrin repeat-containing domain protein [Penicillium hispanicum]|uniref:ankyrin repeat-containing domain protein n=1 Tax=Penicillium hispanicum TaxID=1080232 RepID=UPI002541DA99|nr:ankyrin repeat-containing domain protein [Penicillium hispanicum]KAJ5595264.1 ankyrin repeat-containing domain protein [Penicillium hispanicum]